MRVLCFGDSNTYGHDPCSYLAERYPTEHRWVDLLAKKLNFLVVNAGENGREIPRQEREFFSFCRLVATHGPFDLVIIMLGTNDLLQRNSAATVADRMESFLDRIGEVSAEKLVIAPPPLMSGEWITSDCIIRESIALGPKYKTLCTSCGIHFADAGEWGVSLAYDGVHFTEEGHRAFAKGLGNYLMKEFALC